MAVSSDQVTLGEIKHWASYQGTRRVYGGVLSELAVKRPGNLTKENEIFNRGLASIFKIARDVNSDLTDNALLELIAKLMDSFQICKNNGIKYYRQDLIQIIKK